MVKYITKYGMIFLIFSSLYGCLESNLAPTFDFEKENSSEIVIYQETHGDVINSIDAPWLIDAQSVYDSLKYYLLLDTRPPALFRKAYIDGSINIQPKDILGYIKRPEIKNKYEKIIMISASGQASAYYTALLRLDGYTNVYSLNFGLASWNSDLSGIWVKNCSTTPNIREYTNISADKYQASELPRIYYRTRSNSMQVKIEERVADLMNVEFNDYDSLINTTLPQSPMVDSRAILNSETSKPFYLVCYGNDDLYTCRMTFSPYSGFGHPAGTVLYSPAQSLRGVTDLLNFPKNMDIIIYCYNGQLSAAAAAYLRLLGYNAKSMLFGAHKIFYERLWKYTPSLRRFIFLESNVRNLPYESKEF